MQQYKVDWNKVRLDFVRQNMTIKQLSEKYSVSTTSISKRSTRDGWMRDRETYNAKKINEKADQIIKKVHERKTDTAFIGAGMEQEIKRCIELLGQDDISAQTRYNLIQCVKFAWQVLKEVNGILTRPELEKLEMARQELEMRREDHTKMMNQDLVKQEPIQVIIGGKANKDDEEMAM